MCLGDVATKISRLAAMSWQAKTPLVGGIRVTYDWLSAMSFDKLIREARLKSPDIRIA